MAQNRPFALDVKVYQPGTKRDHGGKKKKSKERGDKKGILRKKDNEKSNALHLQKRARRRRIEGKSLCPKPRRRRRLGGIWVSHRRRGKKGEHSIRGTHKLKQQKETRKICSRSPGGVPLRGPPAEIKKKKTTDPKPKDPGGGTQCQGEGVG